MKICFVTLGDIKSLATMKRALGMADPLDQLGWEVSIIAMDCEENRRRIGLECSKAIDVYYYTEADMKSEVTQKTDIVQTIRPDYIYFCSFSIRNRVIKSKLKFPHKIIIEHSELQSAIPDNNFVKKTLAYTMEYGSLIYADILVCASKYLMTAYKKMAKHILRSGTDLFYSPYAFNKEVVEAPHNLLKTLQEKYANKLVLIYMGTMTRNYGLFTMLEAIQEVSKNNPNVRLLLMGGGRHKKEAEIYVEKHQIGNYISFEGYVAEEDISSYFRLADAFISPLNDTVQDWARCPSKIYMYLPFKKPVLTCAIGEPVEIFGPDGNYFDNKDPLTLTKLIQDLASGQLLIPDVDIEKHSWYTRSFDFNEYIKNLK